MTDGELLENNLLNLTLTRRHFFLLAIRKIDDHVVGLLGSVLQVYGSRSILKDDDQRRHRCR